MMLDHYSRFIPDTKRQRGADRLAAELLAPQVAPVRRARRRPVSGLEGIPKAY